VVGIKKDRIEDYKKIHADSFPGVRDLITAAHMKNFSIFIEVLPDGKNYLFGYYEYTGTDYESDMARMAEEPRNRQWLEETDRMQIPLPGCESWKIMSKVYYNA
ncbi:MAG: L-rhamnose mutarotase, partial [Spirochaetales bacterium]|nr:L-rhamnose mutarotase [Spirochaetales bacterium]